MRAKSLFCLSLSLFLLLQTPTYGQAKRNQELVLLGYNLGLGSGWVLIHKLVRKEKIEVNGLLRGALGGGLLYLGKKAVYTYETNRIPLIIPRLIHATGYSVIDNALANRRCLERFTLELSFLRIHLEKKPQLRFNTLALVSLVGFCFDRRLQLDLKNSLLAGTGVFTFRGNPPPPYNYNIFNSIAYQKIGTSGEVSRLFLRHEYVHSLQNFEYLLFSEALGLNWVNKKIKPFYLDNRLIFSGFYKLQKMLVARNHYQNFYEFEADFFSTNRSVNR